MSFGITFNFKIYTLKILPWTPTTRSPHISFHVLSIDIHNAAHWELYKISNLWGQCQELCIAAKKTLAAMIRVIVIKCCVFWHYTEFITYLEIWVPHEGMPENNYWNFSGKRLPLIINYFCKCWNLRRRSVLRGEGASKQAKKTTESNLIR